MSSEPESCRFESDGGEEVPCGLVEACGDGSKVLELAEEALDQVWLTIDVGIDGRGGDWSKGYDVGRRRRAQKSPATVRR